jgi:hypothetical protein
VENKHADNQPVGQSRSQPETLQEQIQSSYQMPAETRRLPSGYDENPEKAELRYA